MPEPIVLIIYTTTYRKGGSGFKRVAETLKNENHSVHPVRIEPVNSKNDLVALFRDVAAGGNRIAEFHFIGHSGMYGPMFGSVDYPEQFSPYEWGQISIPFGETAKAYFHCCRSARWFASFFAGVFNVETYGYHWYTTFSAQKGRFRLSRHSKSPLYSVGCIGRKSHGLTGSFRKYLGVSTERFKKFSPHNPEDRTYNEVAEHYDRVFQDIKVREDEWNWLNKKLSESQNITLLDIGCGNGALLSELAPRIGSGIGLDLSEQLLEKARERNLLNAHITFARVNGPGLPVADKSIDVAVSLLSFRYLDWDPLMQELKRVMKPGGRLLVIDMVAVPARTKDIPAFLRSKMKHYRHRRKYPLYYKALRQLVGHPAWSTMLKYNPIRSEHEMKWYLESRFPDRKTEKINVGLHASILAFDSGDLHRINALELTYP